MKRWHPIFQSVERTPGVWVMVDALGEPYGSVDLRRTEDGPRYRVKLDDMEIGWANSLKLAVEKVHDAHCRRLTPRIPDRPRWR